MKVLIKFLGLLFFTTIGQFSFGQKQEKIYYSKEWKGCLQLNAAFYRIVSFDEYGKPIGKVTDYFITGEKQGQADSAIYIDKIDDSNSKWDGKVVGFYKTGNKRFENSFKNGIQDGEFSSFYENGKLERKLIFSNGKLVDKWFTECDEFEKCQKVFHESFESNENQNGWELVDEDKFKSEIITEKGLLMNAKGDKGYAQLINLPINISNNFSIETIINSINSEKNNGQGLIWGFKDWENYYYFYITDNGYFTIGAKTEGLSLEFVKWTKTQYINQSNRRNLIKISKIKEKVYYSINSQIVASEDFYTFRGNKIGFSVSAGAMDILFERLIVRQDIGENEASSKFSANSKWKGNGTGFFIDPRGYIITNYHVIEKASEIEINLSQKGNKKSYTAKVISSDTQNDLAILKIEGPNFTPYRKLPYNLRIELSDVGSNVFVLGYPMALSIMGEEIKFTDGKISSKTGYQGNISTYQISVPVQPGNSGGPLFDYDGNIIGVINAKIMAAENVSYAIKSNYLKNLIDVLPEKINLPNDKSLSSLSLTEKIKLLSDYVVLIKIK